MTPAPKTQPQSAARGPWFKRPADLPSNAPTPHTASTWQAQLTRTEYAVYMHIRQYRDDKLTVKRGAKIYACYRAPGYAAIAAALYIDRRTVARAIAQLVAIRPRREEDAPEGEKAMFTHTLEVFGAKGERAGTYYFERPWQETLDAHLADPNIAKTGDGRPLVRGRGRRFMTPADADAWEINKNAVPAAAELRVHTEEPPAAPTRTAPGRAQDEVNEETGEPELGPIHAALLDACGAASEKDAERVEALAVKTNRGRPIPAEAIAEMIAATAEKKRKFDRKATMNVGWICTRIPGEVHGWKMRRNTELQRHAEESRKAARAAPTAAELEELERRLLEDS